MKNEVCGVAHKRRGHNVQSTVEHNVIKAEGIMSLKQLEIHAENV
jgi:hypothetical protein